MKKCSSCGTLQSKEAFHKQGDKRDGLRSQCKTCTNKINLRKYHDDYANSNTRLAANRRHYLKKYGLTEAEFADLLEACDYKCEVCRRDVVPFTTTFGKGRNRSRIESACVDHEHDTGKIRGILCGNCNSGIGLLGDTRDDLLRAVNYIIRKSS